MKDITVTLTSEEYQAFAKYAKDKGITLEALFKKTLEAKLEDELDMKLIGEYEEDIKNGNIETYSHEEVRKMLDI